MDKDQLVKLKQDIVTELTKLIDDGMTPEERFRTYFSVSEALGDPVTMKKAYEAAMDIEDSTIKSSSLMDLLDLVSSYENITFEDEHDNN
ncbi:hypothetical protein H6794_00610 [Candidatus Nomurabacteria bacterium]|nr:hypothetical protein [Candidatus Saccharibacteria bacterium]MCA9350130.1 hypothetical protein [Candidatus Saccharibacteria bacterium]MCB9839342.1 hypothetical protein [Candidatus Nomurabacteria bacterium]